MKSKKPRDWFDICFTTLFVLFVLFILAMGLYKEYLTWRVLFKLGE